jgi:ADP-ribose pyrophosphatase YjhB (NUDIX family)
MGLGNEEGGRSMVPDWLVWARQLQAIAQTGLTYAKDPFDRERYEQVRALAARMMAAPVGLDPLRLEAQFAAEEGYATPKVGVRAGAFREDGAILLVREASDGLWALPGGWADVNQAPSESAAREVLEESGFAVKVRKLAAVYDQDRRPPAPLRPYHIYRMFFVCDITGGSARTSIETTETGFFAEDNVPADLSLNRTRPEHIARMFAHYRNPDLPTEFD